MSKKIAEILALIECPFTFNFPDKAIENVTDIERADENALSFVASKKFIEKAKNTKAYAVFITKEMAELLPEYVNVIIVDNPQYFYTLTKRLFYPKVKADNTISSMAVIEDGAVIESGVQIGHFAVIKAGATVKAGAIIRENVFIGKNCIIGSETTVNPGCVIEYATLGSNCFIDSNVVIGSQGFGFIPNKNGHIDIPQTGTVIIEDDVIIGPGTCIDRGAEKETVIKSGVRIDNLVHIAHNVQIGENAIIAGQCGFAGSAIIGKNTMFGGQAGVTPAVNVGDGAVIMGRAVATKDVPAGEIYAGFPGRPYREWVKQQAKDKRKK